MNEVMKVTEAPMKDRMFVCDRHDSIKYFKTKRSLLKHQKNAKCEFNPVVNDESNIFYVLNGE